jgi:hypothetical protein
VASETLTDPDPSDGLSSKSLPVTVKAGRATFKADLRLRVQCGAEADILGIGAGAELGIYANIIEFVAVLDSTPTCALQSTEWWDLNVGAFAHFDVVVDYTTIGAIPTVSTTLLSAPKFTQCWLEIGGSPGGSPAETGGYLTQTATTVSVAISGSTTALSATVTSPAETGYTETLTTITVPTITTGPSLSETGPLSSSSFKFPLTNSSTPAGGDDLVTSTVYTTTVFTITSCAASVVNCPASYQKEILVTQTIDAYTTVCPATAVVTQPSSISSAAPAAASTGSGATTTATVHIITDVVVLVPCASPIVESFVPGSTVVPPSAHQVTATVYAVTPSSSSSSSSSSSQTASASPLIGGVGKEVQYSNGTATYSASAYGTGKPSASWSQTATPAPARTAVTAGAAGNGAVQGLAVIAGGFVALLLSC